MSNLSSLTIIDDRNLRGVIAPAAKLPKERLVDIIDLIELSTPEVARETEELIAEADNNNSWLPLEEVKKASEESS